MRFGNLHSVDIVPRKPVGMALDRMRMGTRTYSRYRFGLDPLGRHSAGREFAILNLTAQVLNVVGRQKSCLVNLLERKASASLHFFYGFTRHSLEKAIALFSFGNIRRSQVANVLTFAGKFRRLLFCCCRRTWKLIRRKIRQMSFDHVLGHKGLLS